MEHVDNTHVQAGTPGGDIVTAQQLHCKQLFGQPDPSAVAYACTVQTHALTC
jgi:hypothetical protein